MARLNDPPAPVTESLDALKRRFIRQNREIARVNSTQSQRIRNLETEISRLLTENIALREQAIGIAAEAEKWKAASRLGRDVLELKTKLESKLLEVNTIVEALGALPEKAARRSSFKRRNSSTHELTISPNGRDWRNRQMLGGATTGETDGQDGRLPAIMEDKYYPRRTLETEELRILTTAANITNEDTESPDLGPPPIAHFDVADPIAFDSSKSPKRVSGGMISVEDDASILSKNLENRRKRRTSSLVHDMSSLQADPEQLHQGSEQTCGPSLKSIAKRRFEASDQDLAKTQPPDDDGFEYSRKLLSTTSRPASSKSEQSRVSTRNETQSETQSTSPQKTSQPRKALAPKSTNSPAKRAISLTQENKNAPSGNGAQDKRQATHRAPIPQAIRTTEIIVPEDTIQRQDQENAPKTPAPTLEDIMSPPSTTADEASKPKSTEAAITNSVEDVLNGSIGRGSRRARSAVSYVEPNLRDKMRRPDKKLVGAVEGLSKSTNVSEQESGEESKQGKVTDTRQSAKGMRIIRIKSEKKLDEENDAWKNLPEAELKEEIASPLKDKEASSVKTSTDALRRKRTFSESEGTRSKQSSSRRDNDEGLLEKAVSRLSIFDHPDSSPPRVSTEHKDSLESPSQTKAHPASTTATTSRRPTERPKSVTSVTRPRRHSVQPGSNTASNPIDSAIPTTAKTHHRSTSASTIADRDISGKENINIGPSKLKRSTSVQTLPHPSTTSGTRSGNIPTIPSEESVRTLGSRRRSMMV